jgi:fluoride exporter
VTMTGAIAVAIGGVLGAWSRWALSYLFNAFWPSLPPGTLAANLVGGYLIGFLVELFSLHKEIPPEVALFAITGCLGALTFSTFSAEALTPLVREQYVWAICHITSHSCGSLVIAVLGIPTSRRLWAWRDERRTASYFVLGGQRRRVSCFTIGCCAPRARWGYGRGSIPRNCWVRTPRKVA